MKRILIIATSMDFQRMIQEVAEQHAPGEFSIETSASFGQDTAFWSTQAPDFLIISLPEEDLLQEYFFTKLRSDVKKKQVVIFLCSQISAALMQMSTMFSKARILKTPVNGLLIYRTIFDLSQEYKAGHQQVHPRYLTDQPIEIFSDALPEKLKAQMKNLSLGGIYFEADNSAVKLEVGHFYQVSILLGQSQKQYNFDVKVVWSGPRESDQVGYGVAFVNKEDIFNHLLKNI